MPFNGSLKTRLPTPAELRLLRALWGLGEGTIDAIISSFPEAERPNYKTAQTVLRIMETKGFVEHTARGKVFVFRPILQEREAAQLSVRTLLRQNFGGSARGLLINLLQAENFRPGELEEMEQLIRSYREGREE